MMDIVIFGFLFSIFVVFFAISLNAESKIFAGISGLWLITLSCMVLMQKVSYNNIEIASGIPVMEFHIILFLFLCPISLFIIFSNGLDVI